MRDQFQTIFARRWRNQENGVEIVRREERRPGPGFLRNQISHKDRVDSRERRGGRKLLETKLQQGIVITEQHNWDIRSTFRRRDALKDAFEICSAFKRALRRPLNDRTIRDGIAEGNANLDNVGP